MKALFRRYYYKKDENWVQKSYSYFGLKKLKLNPTTKVWHKGLCENSPKHNRPEFYRNDEDGCPQSITANEISGLFNPKINILNITIALFSLSFLVFNFINFSPEININFNQYWGYQDIEGTFNGETAKFRIAFLTNEFAWKFENEFESKEGKVQEFLPKYLKQLPDFKNSLGVIAVGTASEENKDIASEIARAGIRMNEILKSLRLIRSLQGKELYSLNLGQHKEVFGRGNDNPKLTIEQRKIAVIGILERDRNMSTSSLEKALKNALSNKYAALNSQDYSSFKFKRGN